MPREVVLNISKIELATVAYDTDVIQNDGVLTVYLTSHPSSIDATLPGSEITVKVTDPQNNRMLTKGALGVVIFTNIELHEGYWFGQIYDTNTLKKQNSFAQPAKKNSVLFETPDQTGNIELHKETLNIKNDNLEITSNGSEFNIKQDFAHMMFSPGNITLKQLNDDDETFNSLTLGKFTSLDSSNQLRLQASNDILINSNNGNVIVGGVLTDSEDEFSKYAPVKNLILRAKNTLIDTAGGVCVMNAGRIKINLGSAKLSSNKIIDAPKEGYDLSLLSGDMITSIGAGSYSVQLDNKLLLDFIKIRNGSIISPNYSEQKMMLDSIRIEQMSFGMNAKMEMGTGKIEVTSTNDIVQESITGNIKLSAKQNIELNSIMSTKIKAETDIKIESNSGIELKTSSEIKLDSEFEIMMKAMSAMIETQISLKLKSMLLDMSESKMIDMGAKTVLPSKGPLCALPVCCFTGALHTGNMAM